MAEPDTPLVRLARLLVRGRVAVLIVVGAATAFFASHALQLRFESRFDEMLPTSHPFIETHREHAKTFGGANTVLLMLEVEQGTVFNVDTLGKVYRITEELDRIYGVNHYQVESIAHRTNRTLVVAGGGMMEMRPVMARPPTTEEEVRNVARIVHTSQNLYGVLVSLDDKAVLFRASFIEDRLDHRRLFRDLHARAVEPFEDDNTRIYVAGEPELYGWIYHFASEAYWILAATIALSWVLLWLYFRDWRGALRPTITGLIAALWGLGFIHLLGFSLDPLTLVIPFFVTARAVSHSAQMHERYYEELRKRGDQKDAIAWSFAALFVPTLSGIATDALGVLAILLVPIPMLQKLAMTASFWIFAIAVAELLLNPAIYSLLGAPDREMLEARERSAFQRLLERGADLVTAPGSRPFIFIAWALLLGGASVFWTRLVIGDAEAVTPLLRTDSAYNQAHRKIQDRFGGVEPLIVVVEAGKGALQEPENLKTIEGFQRFLERDPGVGASFSYVDLVTNMAAAMHDLEYKWAVVPNKRSTVSLYFGAYFMGTSYAETARFMDPDFSKTAIFFYCTDHRGPTIRRVIARAEEYIAAHPLEDARFRLAGGLIGVLAAANDELLANDVMLNLVGYVTIFLIVVATYRSFAAGILLTVPLLVANWVVHGFMGARGIGINVNTLPVITVGIGFGIDFAFYLVSRTREELTRDVPLAEAVRAALCTAGKAITFTGFAMIASVLFWTFSEIRFNAEMGALLAVWMGTSFLATVTLLPALLLAVQPRFLRRTT